ncbi:MAG: ABC transporter permease, partial [Planctomycetota bacterium]
TAIVDAVRSFSFLTHFTAISKGVIDAKDIVFFASLIGCFLFANTLVIDLKKAD